MYLSVNYDAWRSDNVGGIHDVVRAFWSRLLLGCACAVVGLAPWLATGARLPLQNLWATQTMPGDMPVALLPFNQYYLQHLFGVIVVPGLLAGCILRWRATPRRLARVWATLIGLAVIQFIVLCQTLLVVVPGMQRSSDATVYLVAITAYIVASMVIALLVCAMFAVGKRPVAAVALSAGALAVGYWLTPNIFPAWLQQVPSEIVRTLQYVPPVMLGIALAWIGWRPRRQLRNWILALAVFATLSVTVDFLVALVSSRALMGDAAAMLRMAVAGLPGSIVSALRLCVIAIGAVVVFGLADNWLRPQSRESTP